MEFLTNLITSAAWYEWLLGAFFIFGIVAAWVAYVAALVSKTVPTWAARILGSIRLDVNMLWITTALNAMMFCLAMVLSMQLVAFIFVLNWASAVFMSTVDGPIEKKIDNWRDSFNEAVRARRRNNQQ